MHNRRRELNDDRGKARRRGDLADAASGMGRLMREVAVTNSSSKGTGCVRQPRDEDATGNERARYPIKRVQYLSLGEMLKDIGGRYCGELPGSRIKQVTVVAFLNPVQARGLGYGHLFRADINPGRVVAISSINLTSWPRPQPMSSTGPAVGARGSGRMSRR